MNIALLGFGTIGSGVYELINLNKGKFAGNFTDLESRKASPVITKVLERDTTKDLGDTVGKIVTDPREILDDDSIGLVIALIGVQRDAGDQIGPGDAGILLQHGQKVDKSRDRVARGAEIGGGCGGRMA